MDAKGHSDIEEESNKLSKQNSKEDLEGSMDL